MVYENNPEEVLNDSISLTSSSLEMNAAVKRIVKAIMVANDAHHSSSSSLWANAEEENISIIDLCGGITNKLFLVEHEKAEGDSRVIVRTYGNGTDMFIDRMNENIVFSHLSKSMFGPAFHGLFEGGRIEGYIPSNTLQPKQMKDPQIYRKIAVEVAELHKIDVMEIRGPADHYWLWDKIKLFFKIAAGFNFEGDKKAQLDALHLPNLFEELHTLQSLLMSFYDELVNSGDLNDYDSGRLHAFEQVLCHNDLLSGNILLYDPSKEKNGGSSTAKKDVFIIDYEYAAYNFRAFDLANHFNGKSLSAALLAFLTYLCILRSEFGGFDFDIVNEFPSEELRKDFIREYSKGHVNYHNVSDDFVQGFHDITLVLCLASHLMWGSWAVVQAGFTTLEFDYLGYAKLRFDGYYYHKELFSSILEACKQYQRKK